MRRLVDVKFCVWIVSWAFLLALAITAAPGAEPPPLGSAMAYDPV